MRPLRLSLEGIRSYRSRVEIDLTDDGLMAIVGDTGSGKSSILEGLTYALYNASTWSGKDVRELLADGATVMSVELEFEAEGERHRVHRATSRSNYPPAVHRIKCLTDGSRPEIDGVEGVKNEVHRLVGLSYDAFLSAVILPQGKFQSLLQAKRGDRVDILKGIFRLDVVETARGEAQSALSRMDAALGSRSVERARLLDDPEGTARARDVDARAAAKREKELGAVTKAVETALAAHRSSDRRIATMSVPRNALDEAPADAAARMRSLLPRAGELSNQMAAIKSQRTAVDRQADDLKAALAGLGKKGEGPEALNRAIGILDRVDRDLDHVAEREEHLRSEETALKTEETALSQVEKGLREMEKAETGSAAKARDLETAAKVAEKNLENARALLEKAIESVNAAARHDADGAALKKRVVAAVEITAELDTRIAAAAGDRETAETALAALLRRHAAAHAAEGVEAGDDCPICARPLPKGFKPPKATGEAKARAAVEKAIAAERKAIDAGTEARAARTVLENESGRWEAEKKSRAAETAARRKALEVLVPAASSEPLSEALLESAAAMLEEKRGAAEAAMNEARKARDAFVEARAALEPRRKALDDGRERVNREITTLRKTGADCVKALAGLPKFLAISPETSPAGRAAARAEIERRRQSVAADVARLETLRDTARGLAKEEADASSVWTAEVEGPMRSIERDLDHLYRRVGDAGTALGDRAETMTEAKTLEERADWADRLASRRLDLLKRLEEALDAERRKIAAAETEAEAALRASGFESAEDLEAARIETRATLQIAKKEAAVAREQIARARELDLVLKEGRGFRAALSELAQSLADGKFVAHVIDRRQKELLGVATGILGGMTGGRYGFSGDFQVVDLETGQPRSTRTLSGGESFLASLSLALALVEIAGRSGGRLDALFLDEGFGALDANALDEALSALESRAGDGRLVAVVSHLKAVAERIDRVLYVTKTPSGSAARWISGRERDDLVDREIEAGLLA